MNGFPVSTSSENTDTLLHIGSCIMKEEHNQRCGNLTNHPLIQHSKSLLYISMSTDTFNTPKGRGLLKNHDCSLSLSFSLSTQSKEKHTSCLCILPDIVNVLPVLRTVSAVSFQQPCTPHVHRVRYAELFCRPKILLYLTAKHLLRRYKET